MTGYVDGDVGEDIRLNESLALGVVIVFVAALLVGEEFDDKIFVRSVYVGVG